MKMEIFMKHSGFINSYSKPLLSTYFLSDSVLGTKGTSLNKTKFLFSWSLYFGGGGIYVNKNNMKKYKAGY